MIAQALAPAPDLLLLDEPLDSLDLPNQAAVAALIARSGRSQGLAVMIVMHDVNPVLSHLNTVVYLAPSGSRIGPSREVITGTALSQLFGTPIEVLTASDGRLVVVGQPDARNSLRPAPRAAAMTLAEGPSWSPITDLAQMWSYPFMVNAFRAAQASRC